VAKDVCEVDWVDGERVERARAGMRPDGLLLDLGETFKVLGETTRVRILHALALEELCVGDLSALLAMSASAVSHQLRILRAAKLVRFRREGKMVYYSLDDDHIRNLLDEGLRHVEER